jgi:hypothetical protein
MRKAPVPKGFNQYLMDNQQLDGTVTEKNSWFWLES